VLLFILCLYVVLATRSFPGPVLLTYPLKTYLMVYVAPHTHTHIERIEGINYHMCALYKTHIHYTLLNRDTTKNTWLSILIFIFNVFVISQYLRSPRFHWHRCYSGNESVGTHVFFVFFYHFTSVIGQF